MPTISTSSLTLITPRSTRPVTTVPRPVIVKTSSTGIRNGLSVSRTGSGIDSSTAVHQVLDGLDPLRVALERLERRDLDDRSVLVELLGSQQFADLQLDELEQLLVVDRIGLVQGDQNVGHADLAREQHVLTSLRHRAVGGRDHQDRAVHLGGAGDHVLDVVGVARGVDVRVVTLLGLVLHVRDVDRDTALLLFRSLVDVVERRDLIQIGKLVVQNLRDRCGQRRLAVVNVTDGPDVDVRLRPLELRLRHCVVLLDLLVLAKAVLMFSVVFAAKRTDY